MRCFLVFIILAVIKQSSCANANYPVQTLLFHPDDTDTVSTGLRDLWENLSAWKDKSGNDCEEWVKSFYQFIDEVYGVYFELSCRSITSIDKNYCNPILDELKEFGNVKKTKVMCDGFKEKLNISTAYTTAMQAFAKTLPNYKLLNKDLRSKKLLKEYSDINKIIKTQPGDLKAKVIGPKIENLIKSKRAKLDETKASTKNFWQLNAKTLRAIYTKSVHVNDLLKKLSEEYDRARSFEEILIPIFKKYIEMVDVKGTQTVKDELTKASEKIGKSIQLLHDLVIDLPTKILEIFNDKGAADKGAAKGAKLGAKGGKK